LPHANQAPRHSASALLLSIAALLLSLCCPVVPAQAASAGTNYYVDSRTGSDSNPGTSADRPWQSLAPVEAHHFLPGDVINLARGSTWTGGLFIDDSGVEGSPITFQAYGEGAAPILRNPGTWTTAVTIEANWVVLSGVMVRDAYEYGIRIAAGADHNTITGCEVTQVGQGVGVFGQHNLVTHCYLHDLVMVVNTPGGSDDYGAVGVVVMNSYNEISYNRMVRCSAPSYDFGNDGGAVEFYGNVDGCLVHHNWATENDGFMEIANGSSADNVVAYNVMYNNRRAVVFHTGGSVPSAFRNFRLENNTIVEVDTHPDGSWEWVLLSFWDAAPPPGSIIIRNNIFYMSHVSHVANLGGFDHDHNLYYLRDSGADLGFALGAAEQIADPLFVNLAAQDFALQPGSPCVDRAAPALYGVDFAGHPVPSGAGPDEGAFEYALSVTSTPSAAPSPMPSATATPVPTPVPTATPSRAPTLTPTVSISPSKTPTAVVSSTGRVRATPTIAPMRRPGAKALLRILPLLAWPLQGQ